MQLLSKLDALIVLVTAATGMAMVEDRNRTEIVLPQPVQVSHAMTPEVCAEQEEYRRRAMRVMLLLTGGMPDMDWRTPAKPTAAACEDKATPGDTAGRNRDLNRHGPTGAQPPGAPPAAR